MTSFRAAFLAALCSIFLASCGDTFRPIAIPQPGPLPPFQASKTAQVITGTGPGTVTNYNLSGATVTGQAVIGQGPGSALLFGSRVYVANQADNTLSLYTALSPQSPSPGTVTLSPGALPVTATPLPQGIATGPNSAFLYIAYTNLDAVGVISTATNTEIGTIPLGPSGDAPEVMMTNNEGSKLFVGNTGSNNISVIDLSANSVIATIGGCSHPSAMARTPDTAYLYVVCRDSNNLLIINTNTNFADFNITVGAQPVSATFDLVRKRLIVTSAGANTVTFFEENFALPMASQHVQTIVPVGAAPAAAAPLPSGSKVYIANSGSGTVSVIDSAALTLINTIAVGGQPQAIGASSDSTRVAVTTTGPDVLQVIDTTTDTLNASHALAGPPRALLIF